MLQILTKHRLMIFAVISVASATFPLLSAQAAHSLRHDYTHHAGKVLAKMSLPFPHQTIKTKQSHPASPYIKVGQENLHEVVLPQPIIAKVKPVVAKPFVIKEIPAPRWSQQQITRVGKKVKHHMTPMEHLAAAKKATLHLKHSNMVVTSHAVMPNQTITIQPSQTNKQVTQSSSATTDSTNMPGFSLNKQLGLSPKSRVHVNGFISAGGSRIHAGNGAQYNIPDRGSLDDNWNFATNSLIGLQVTGNITDKISAVGQIVADGDDTNGNNPYNVDVEWAFLRYQPNSKVEMRVGRFRLPAFLYSETAQVGYTYPWMFLPNEVYRIVPFTNINGIDTIYSLPLGSTGWTVKVNPYFGMNESKFDLYTRGATPAGAIPQGTTATFDENDIVGMVISLSNPFITLRGTYVHVHLTGFIPSFVPAGGTKLTLFSNQPSEFYSLGAKVNYHNFLVASEFAHRSMPSGLTSLSGIYGVLGYHFGKLLPTITYGNIWTTNWSSLRAQPVSELPQQQDSYSLGMAYYINSNLVAKGSVSYIVPLNGTNGLFTVNPGRNVLLYGLEVDAIF